MLGLREVRTIDFAMDDGARLKADVYRPVGEARYPVLVMRQPYGRKIGSTVVLAHPAWYAAQGYIVLVQDVRGRGESEGRFRVLEDDFADGARTLALAAELDGGDGHVASYGFSYHGMNQYMGLAGALERGSRAPDAMAIVMAAYDVRDDWAYEGGAFRLAAGQTWARQMGIENARRAGAFESAEKLATATAPLYGGPYPGKPALLETCAAHTPYFDWLADDPAYWARVSPSSRLAGRVLKTPVLHVGGWQDFLLTGTFRAHRAFADGKLIVGPWAHIPWGRRLGALDGGEAAADGIDREIVAFFDHRLKGREDSLPAVRLHDMGAGRWRDFDAWPVTAALELHLASNGRAAASQGDGTLQAAPAAFADRLVHDPWRPAPAVGGPLGTPGLFANRAEVDDRGDVLTYTSAPLDAPLTLIGEPVVDLCVTSDRPSFDLSLALSWVRPDGAAIHITGAFRTIESPGRLRLALRPCAFTLPAGARLRLSIQAAAYPAFAVNPGAGQRAVDAHVLDAVVTTLVLSGTAEAPCVVALPVLAGESGGLP